MSSRKEFALVQSSLNACQFQVAFLIEQEVSYRETMSFIVFCKFTFQMAHVSMPKKVRNNLVQSVLMFFVRYCMFWIWKIFVLILKSYAWSSRSYFSAGCHKVTVPYVIWSHYRHSMQGYCCRWGDPCALLSKVISPMFQCQTKCSVALKCFSGWSEGLKISFTSEPAVSPEWRNFRGASGP